MEIFKYILNKDEYVDCNFELELETYTLRKFDKHVKENDCPTCDLEKTKYLNIFDLMGVIKDEYQNKLQF